MHHSSTVAIANPYLDFYRQVGGQQYDFGNLRQMLAHRDEGIQEYAFAVPNQEALDTIARYGPILEMGAGTGYWAHLLRQMGVDVMACDQQVVADGGDNQFHFRRPWTAVVQAKAGPWLALHPDRTLLLVWPDYSSPFGRQCLDFFTGDRLIYVGEGYGGCTGDDAFHKRLNREWTECELVDIPQWDGVHDYLQVYQRLHPRSVHEALRPRRRRLRDCGERHYEDCPLDDCTSHGRRADR